MLSLRLLDCGGDDGEAVDDRAPECIDEARETTTVWLSIVNLFYEKVIKLKERDFRLDRRADTESQGNDHHSLARRSSSTVHSFRV